MLKFLKKWTIIHKPTQAVTGLVYLFVTFFAPLNHTCNRCEKAVICHCDNPEYCCVSGIHTDTQPEVALKQDVSKAQTPSHSGICMACLYSLISKFTQVNTAKTLINTSAPNHFRIPFTFKVIKQSEWGSSVFLRAPPTINS
jgi:hypothetical protein